MSEQPIGIFDSGVGGLTVCNAINELLPEENIIYFGDTARFPYGTRTEETIIRYSKEIVTYLQKRNVKMIVIACNTASASALDAVKSFVDIPVVGVIEAGARAACKKNSNNIIGVIGTRATIKSESYVRSILNINKSIKVLQNQATLFVSIIEEGLTHSEIAKLAVKEYIEEMYSDNVRTLILGCTHFPLLKDDINDVYPDLSLIDTGHEIAYEVKQILQEKSLENNLDILGNKGNIELYASDITDNLMRLKDVFFEHKGTSIERLIINGKGM